jgi:hypothetical protein
MGAGASSRGSQQLSQSTVGGFSVLTRKEKSLLAVELHTAIEVEYETDPKVIEHFIPPV